MNFTDPIKDIREIKALKNYYLAKKNYRNNLLIHFGLYTALRISDILNLKWGDIYDFEHKKFFKYLTLREQKTGKFTKIILNEHLIEVAMFYLKNIKDATYDQYIFTSQKSNSALKRGQAHKIIKRAAKDLNIEGNISCHSLRKTFGYMAWKNGVDPATLMQLYNHSSFEATKHYLCISQDEKDLVFINVGY